LHFTATFCQVEVEFLMFCLHQEARKPIEPASSQAKQAGRICGRLAGKG
jgi:hypothetical protein